MKPLTPSLVLLMAAGLFALFMVLFVVLRPLLPVDETRYLSVAWDMWQGSSMIVPRLNGELYSHKPPLLFWLMNLVWTVGGLGEITPRLVAPSFGVLSVILTGLLARKLWPDATERAGLAALIVATSVVFMLFGSTTMFDSMLTAATVAAMLALVALRRAPGLLAVLGLGAAIAFGVFAKGPVILVHVLPAALLMPLWADQQTRPALFAWYRDIALAVVVALVLVGLWLGPALVIGGEEYRTDVLWRQSAGRMVDSFAHDRPVWFFVAMLPVFAWPWGWSRAALAALGPRRLVGDEATRLVLIWAVGALVAFSLISGKQVHYLLPEMPALALILSGMAVGGLSIWRRGVLLVPALLAGVLAIAIFAGMVEPAKVNGATFTFVNLALVVAVVAALVAIVVSRFPALWSIAAAAPLTLLALHLTLYPMMWAGYDPTPIAAVLAQDQDRGVATVDTGYAGQFTFEGRLKRPLPVLTTPEAVTDWMAAHPGGTLLSRNQKMSEAGLTLVLARSFHGKDYRIYKVDGPAP
jgi:4-amino-4-deoxy-L-arabinose transferase-like glycosyltransferase